MLNKPLYEALVAAFKDVGVANQGEHAQIIPAPSLPCLWRVPNRDEAGQRGEQYRVNCPFCGDTRKRLYISYLSYARPTVRGVKLPQGPLRAYCQNEHCMDDWTKRSQIEGRIARAMNGVEQAVDIDMTDTAAEERERPVFSNEVTVEGIRTWVPDYEPISAESDPVVLEYLSKRRITEEDVSWLRIGCGPIRTRSHGMLKNGVSWVIFPVIQNHQLVGVQARCPEVYMEPGDKMKYWFHPNCRKAAALYNIDVARQLGVGVVCEGVFDVASVGLPGVCCFGHTPSAFQRSMLASIGSALIWLPDRDANKECNPVEIASRFVRQWNDAGTFAQGAHVVLLSKKDAGEMTRAEVWREILAQVPPSLADWLNENVVGKL